MFFGQKWIFSILFTSILMLGLGGSLDAQTDNRIAFQHRVGNPAPEGNLFRIRGDFTVIGNTSLTLAAYNDTSNNSANQMMLVDIDQDPFTFNSSSATLMFSQENGAEPSCTDILYAGLYWSGRAEMGKGMVFEQTKESIPGTPERIDSVVQEVLVFEELYHTSYTMQTEFGIDTDYYPIFILESNVGYERIQFRFTNDGKVSYLIGGGGWLAVDNLTVETTDGISTATFDPVIFTDKGINLAIQRLSRSAVDSPYDFDMGDNVMQVMTSGTYVPHMPHTASLDKRMVKLKGPGDTDYTEIRAAGNSVLFPHEELNEMYVGYADVTSYVKSRGMGEYTVANMPLAEGWGDATGFYGHWGIVVVYQNAKMQWRDVTVFDGYSFVQSLDEQEHVGEIEIKGFGAVKQGPVDVKLGVMAGEGDRSIEGDYLEIINQKGEWVRLHHRFNSTTNFFNSSIYTPIRNKDNLLVNNPRNPNLRNNTGIDIVLWDIPNPGNSIIANEQTSTRFRFGTKQDVYGIYAFAFSVRSYSPDIQVLNTIESVNGLPPGEDPTVKPGEEIQYSLEIRNRGEEAARQTRIVIPIPHTATFVDARASPEAYGKVTFDPDMGFAGAIVWEVGDVPLLAESDEIIASLQYTLKVTEDCFVLANDNCEATAAIDGTISGIGSVSETVFNNMPFNQGRTVGACSDEQTHLPSEIPIVGRAEFAQSRCSGYEPFSGLGTITLPDFCQRDVPVDLLSLITPSQKDYNIYFFRQELGGDPLFNYQVNTAIAGTEQVWVSEGPAGSCTGFRVPVVIKVLPLPSSPVVTDLMFCSSTEVTAYGVNPVEGYELVYYPDNDPNSAPMKTIPQVDTNIPGIQAVWVSQIKEGECESARVEVKVIVEDCPGIKVTITPELSEFHTEGQVVTFTVVVENPGRIDLHSVVAYDQLTKEIWNVQDLGPFERKTFTTGYTVNGFDLVNRIIYNSVDASGRGAGIDVYDRDDASIAAFTPGFLDYKISVSPANCSADVGAKGIIEINFQKGAQTGSYELVGQDDGQVFSEYFENKTSVVIEVPHGEYTLTIYDQSSYPHEVPGRYHIEESKEVEFDVPIQIAACLQYRFRPETEDPLEFTLRDPNGSILTLQGDGFYELNMTGTYSIRGADRSGTNCPVQKTFEVSISQPTTLDVEILPFCNEDFFTTIQLLNDPEGYLVHWYRLGSQSDLHLPEFDNHLIFTAQEDGDYEVRMTEGEGCLIGRGRVQIARSYAVPPQLSQLYTICPGQTTNSSITAGSLFSESIWYMDGREISNAPVFVPDKAGLYSLATKDSQGCLFFADFEVEVKCEPTIRYPNAIKPGVPDKAFIVYPDNLTEEFEVIIQNRWGEMIYHCEDNDLAAGRPSTCVWDGTVRNQLVPIGNYPMTIRYKIKEKGLVLTEKGVISVVE